MIFGLFQADGQRLPFPFAPSVQLCRLFLYPRQVSTILPLASGAILILAALL